MRKYFELIVFLLVLGFVAFGKTTAQETEPPYVILISFDGFRHDYVEKYDPPHFKEFISEGAAAAAMTPSFPSKTFPNHYTIVTGMYPGNHGLVDNGFYDKPLDVQYGMGNRALVENPAFYGGLPLWQLVQEHGMKSASYFWVGSEVKIKGRFPDYYHKYDGSVPNETRIEATIDWLKLPKEERPNFISLYFSLVDSQGHATGPDSPETKATVLEADRLLGLLMQKLENIDLPVNVIITSDHGMKTVPNTEENLMAYEDLMQGIDKDDYRLVSNGAHAHIYLNDKTKQQQIFETLQSREHHFTVYKKSDIPENWHYQHERVGDIFFTMEPGFYLSSKNRKPGQVASGGVSGQHGFDPYTTPEMGAIFYAQGPNIKAGTKLGRFENVHVYPLIAHILGIEQYPKTDGDLSVLLPVYK
jgi:predicted AlkP superfamily pyrophosphatase or phosphodiesterase